LLKSAIHKGIAVLQKPFQQTSPEPGDSGCLGAGTSREHRNNSCFAPTEYKRTAACSTALLIEIPGLAGWKFRHAAHAARSTGTAVSCALLVVFLEPLTSAFVVSMRPAMEAAFSARGSDLGRVDDASLYDVNVFTVSAFSSRS